MGGVPLSAGHHAPRRHALGRQRPGQIFERVWAAPATGTVPAAAAPWRTPVECQGRIEPRNRWRRFAWRRLPAAYRRVRPASWIAFQTRSGVIGMSMWRIPRWATASTTAFCTAGVAPIVPDSPMPLAPSGLWGLGVTVVAVVTVGISLADGIR